MGRGGIEDEVERAMPPAQLTGFILASALITLNGTATTIALPAIGHDLATSVFRLQWISNAPLLSLAALLLPAGMVADRFGRVHVMRVGLMIFIAGAMAGVVAGSDAALIGATFVQGAGGALVLPAALAPLRDAYTDPAERARVFGTWAAWTGVASAIGPLVAGGLVDLLSWRAVFVPSAIAAIAAILLVKTDVAGAAPTRKHPVPLVATVAMMVMLGAAAYLLMALVGGDVDRGHVIAPAVLMGLAAVPLARDPQRHLLIPRELLRSRNCVPANASTFALYFGMFGLSFLVALYTQQALGYSALRAALVLLPISVMLFFAERFGRLTALVGTRALIVGGALSAAAGLAWMAGGPHPLPFWSRLIVGTGLFGLGISLAVSALTHAAVAAVPETCAGAASGLNHAVVRAAGLVAVALLGSLAAPGVSDAISAEGFSRAMTICAAVVGFGGVLGTVWLREGEPGGISSSC
jgi:MFS family permease